MLETLMRTISALGPLVEDDDSYEYPHSHLVAELEMVYKAIRDGRIKTQLPTYGEIL